MAVFQPLSELLDVLVIRRGLEPQASPSFFLALLRSLSFSVISIAPSSPLICTFSIVCFSLLILHLLPTTPHSFQPFFCSSFPCILLSHPPSMHTFPTPSAAFYMNNVVYSYPYANLDLCLASPPCIAPPLLSVSIHSSHSNALSLLLASHFHLFFSFSSFFCCLPSFSLHGPSPSSLYFDLSYNPPSRLALHFLAVIDTRTHVFSYSLRIAYAFYFIPSHMPLTQLSPLIPYSDLCIVLSSVSLLCLSYSHCVILLFSSPSPSFAFSRLLLPPPYPAYCNFIILAKGH